MTVDHLHCQFEAFGTPDVLRVATSPVPVPGPGEARIRVEAASVQFTDTLIRRGIYPDLRERPPHTSGYDFVGVVDAVGEGVHDVSVGDRVADLTTIGANAQFVVRPAAGLVPVPASVDGAEATTLVLSWLTAEQALFRVGRLAAGEKVLVIGGNGAVGLAAIELAVAAGAEVWTTASERHHSRLGALGARVLPRGGWAEEVRNSMDVVLDGVAIDGFRSSHRALRQGGRLVAIGISALASGSLTRQVMAMAGLGWRAILPNGRTSRFYSITARRKRLPNEFREDLATLFQKLERGDIRPVVAERLSLEQVSDAHARLESGGMSGKLVLDPWA